MAKPLSHQANVVRLGHPSVHANADTLELFFVGGYQIVTKKGSFKEGDLAVYIQPDSAVPQTEAFRFIWGQHEITSAVEGVPSESTVPERRRRITVKKLRKEWSEGLLMPLEEFFCAIDTVNGIYYAAPQPTGEIISLKEGDDVSDLIGITHWDGDNVEPTQSENDSRPKRERPRTLKGWFYFTLYRLGIKGVKKRLNEELSFDVPKFDVENIKNFKNTIRPDDHVIVTEKIHGSQGRYFFREGRMYVGSRNTWKAASSPCVWRKALKQHPWIEQYCRENEGNVLYGEVVPTQRGYRYGCEEDQTNFFVFDIRDGVTGKYLPKQVTMKTGGITRVPLVYEGVYGTFDLNDWEAGPSLVPGAKTQKEGIVITVTDPTRWQRGLGRIQLKKINNAFLEKDSK